MIIITAAATRITAKKNFDGFRIASYHVYACVVFHGPVTPNMKVEAYFVVVVVVIVVVAIVINVQ